MVGKKGHSGRPKGSRSLSSVAICGMRYQTLLESWLAGVPIKIGSDKQIAPPTKEAQRTVPPEVQRMLATFDRKRNWTDSAKKRLHRSRRLGKRRLCARWLKRSNAVGAMRRLKLALSALSAAPAGASQRTSKSPRSSRSSHGRAGGPQPAHRGGAE